MSEPYFSLVVLCYRSGESIIPFVERLQRTLSRCNFSWELVLVGNYIEGSDDETPQVVTKLAENSPNIRTVIRPKQGMMGWDMRMGLDAARGGLFIDATLGLGGHSELILRASPNSRVIGFDRDAESIELASERLGGLTHWTRGEDGQHEVALEVDGARFFQHYFSVF